MKSFIAKRVNSILVNLRYLRFKLLKYKENNKKMCNTFDHDFKNIPLYNNEKDIIRRVLFCIIRWCPYFKNVKRRLTRFAIKLFICLSIIHNEFGIKNSVIRNIRTAQKGNYVYSRLHALSFNNGQSRLLQRWLVMIIYYLRRKSLRQNNLDRPMLDVISSECLFYLDFKRTVQYKSYFGYALRNSNSILQLTCNNVSTALYGLSSRTVVTCKYFAILLWKLGDTIELPTSISLDDFWFLRHV